MASGNTHRYYYLDGGMLYHKESKENRDELLFMQTDNLGSIRRIYGKTGSTVFEATYDAWGQRTVVKDSINFRRGYTGHEHLPEYGLINMNGRLYDPLLGRFLSPDPYVQLPDFSQNYNRYSYCLNNPLKYTDPDGEWLFSAVTGFIKGTFRFLFKGGKWTDPFKYAYKDYVNSLKVELGLFKGSPKQILSRFTWELPQTIIGYNYSMYRITFEHVDHVRFFDGATYIIRDSKESENGITIGSYININNPQGVPTDENGKFAPWKNSLYIHEYGHYLQSQEYGLGYLFSVGIPSLLSAINRQKEKIIDKYGKEFEVSSHRIKSYEMNANRKAFEYFSKKYGITYWDEYKYPFYIY